MTESEAYLKEKYKYDRILLVYAKLSSMTHPGYNEDGEAVGDSNVKSGTTAEGNKNSTTESSATTDNYVPLYEPAHMTPAATAYIEMLKAAARSTRPRPIQRKK